MSWATHELPSAPERLLRGTTYQFARMFLPSRPLTAAPSVLGLRFSCLPGDDVGRSIYRRGTYEPAMLRVLEQHLRVEQGDIAVDIGANIGWYSCILGKLLEGRGRVVALEPEPANNGLLRANVALNRLSNVEPIQCAASDAPGSLTLNIYKSSNRGRHSVLPIHEGRGVEIPAVRVDDLLAERGLEGAPVAFLKIDVEGYEAPALRGATKALARCRMALVEWSPEYMRRGGIEPAALADILFGAGFEVQLIGAGGSAMRVTRDELLATAEQRDLLCLRA